MRVALDRRAEGRRAGQLIALACVLGCGSAKESRPSTGSGSGPGATSAPGTVRRLASVHPSGKLIAGTRRVALVTEQGYLEPGAPPTPGGQVSAELEKLAKEFLLPEVFLATHPIVVGGEEHHEKHVQLTPAPREVELHGHLVRAVALADGKDVWQFEEKLRARLAVVDERGALLPLPDHELVGPPLDHPSPVVAKQCATPKIADLAATAGVAIALLIECHADAPVRVVSYTWPGPKIEVERLPSTKQLGFEPDHVVAAGDRRALIGAAANKLVIHRLGNARREDLLDGTTRVLAATMTDDGAVWTLTIGASGARQVARDGVPVRLADPSGAALSPQGLGFDLRHGVTILAHDRASAWLFGER
jgi:hypothetical protein